MTRESRAGRLLVYILLGMALFIGLSHRAEASAATTYGGIDYAPVYNYSYYIKNNPDVKRAYGNSQAKAIRHFALYGTKEGRQGSASFNVVFYKNRYADLKKAYGNQTQKYYLHYIRYGRKEGRFATAAEEQNWQKSRKYIMIGDSNACIGMSGHSNSVSWPELMTQQLGLSKSQVRYLRAGGYGFAGLYGQFIKLLKTVNADPKVTDILIVGGAGNDFRHTQGEIAKAYNTFVKEAKRRFPNARIMHAVPNWHLTSTAYQNGVIKNIPLYQQLAKANGVIYITGTEKVLRGKRAYFFSDNLHWNRKGEQAVVAVLAPKVKALDKNRYRS